MQYNTYSPTATGAPSAAYSTSSPSSQLQYRHTPGPFSTEYSSYSSYPTPVTEYPPYPPYSSASYDPVAATASPTSTHPQRQHQHQQPAPAAPAPHYAFTSTPATTECVGISRCVPISDLVFFLPSHLACLFFSSPRSRSLLPSQTNHVSLTTSSSSSFPSHSLDHHQQRDSTRRISVPLSTSHSPPMYSPTTYSAQGHPQWHRDRSGSFPDLPYHHPAAAAVAVTAHGLARYDSSPLSTAAGNVRWQTQQQQQQQYGPSPSAPAPAPSQAQTHTHHQSQYQSQPINSIARPSYTPTTTSTSTGTGTGMGTPEAEPEPHLQSTSMIPSVFNAGYPYYAQPATAPPAPATGVRTSPHTSTPAYPSLNTDVAAPFNTGLPPSAALSLSSTLPSATSAPSTSLSPSISARSTSSQHSAGDGDDAVSPRRRPRMRGIIPTSMRELEPNVKQEIDSWLLRYLNRLCGDGTSIRFLSPLPFSLPLRKFPPSIHTPTPTAPVRV